MFFSDHGTPQGWRNEHGYGCHTFKWVCDIAPKPPTTQRLRLALSS
jgi:hypothetical protein